MKLSLILLIFTQSVFAIELSAGMRESFLSATHHVYGGDSTARLRRLLLDRGFDSLTLNTKLVVGAAIPSYVHKPMWSSDIKDLDTMISLTRLGRGNIIIKPQIIKGEMDDIIPYEIEGANLDARTLLYTYQRELTPYYKLSRETDFSNFIFGSGINLLYRGDNEQELIAMHKQMRRSLSSNTKLLFNIGNLSILDSIEKKIVLRKNMQESLDGISYSINELSLNLLNTEDYTALSLELESLYKKHREVFGQLTFSLSDVILPVCSTSKYDHLDMNCTKPLADKKVKRQLEKFAQMVVDLDSKGIKIKHLEFLASSTDFEPDVIKPSMLYYKKFFKSINLKDLFYFESDNLRVDSPIPVIEMGEKLACVYYDAEDTVEKKDNLGRIHSTMLESLLGGFPNYHVKRFALKDYALGQINECEKAFYIASHFSSVIPENFIKDVKKHLSSKSFMWFNYKFFELQKSDGRIVFEVPYTLPADSVPTADNIDVGFYQFFEYKGEEFYKKIGWSPLSNNFISSAELHLINIKETHKVDVLSLARHNRTNKKTPYIVKQNIDNGSLWYVADLPFSFIHYEDRYLILTDILWDFLEETPKSDKLKALVRIEDVNPSLLMQNLNWAMSYLASEDVPFSLALIPYYADMAGVTEAADYRPTFKPITKYPEFKASLKYAKSLGADFVWHGVAHQVDDFVSGYDGTSGSDYEFWLYPENVPIPYDSVDWVMNRLEKGEKVLKELEIMPAAWEIPHYAASVLDYYIFAKIFEWTYHRPIVFSHSVKQDTALKKEHLMFTCETVSCREERKAILRNISVEADYSEFGASLYPYPIYKDTYGQKIIPETLGMIDFAFYSKNTWRPVSTPEDIIRRAKKLRVIRGAYASFFWHTPLLSHKARYYLENPGSFEEIGGKKTLIKVIEGLKNLGYEFVSISSCKEFPQKGCKE